MARTARVVVPGFPHHVCQRGSRRLTTFYSDDDYRCYLDALVAASARFATRVWAYCLMPNHVHFVMVPSSPDGLWKVFGECHRRYSLRINSRNGWQGHLWQGRFFSVPMDDRHCLAAIRYVELNPVVANLCTRAGDWRWSSAPAHCVGEVDPVLSPCPLVPEPVRWQAYLEDVDDGTFDDRLRRHTRSNRPLGDDSFVARLETLTGRALRPRKRGPKPRRS